MLKHCIVNRCISFENSKVASEIETSNTLDKEVLFLFWLKFSKSEDVLTFVSFLRIAIVFIKIDLKVLPSYSTDKINLSRFEISNYMYSYHFYNTVLSI